MPAQLQRLARRALPVLRAGIAALPLALLGACSSVTAQQGLTNTFKPYRPDVVQGNFVSSEMAAALKPGMSREQVRDILGTPLLQDLFHADRWQYVFSLRQGYGVPIVRRYTVYFDADGKMLRAEGDPLPSEDAFVSQINALHQGWTKPKTMTADQLQAQIAAAHDKLPPAASAPAAASGPLNVVAPRAEIERLQAYAPASAPQ